MSRYFVIWGCAGHAKVLVSIVQSQGDVVLAFFDNRSVPSILPEVPVYLGESGFDLWAREGKGSLNVTGLVAIGGHRGADRLKIQRLFRAAQLNLLPLIHPAAFVCSTATIGEGSQVLAQAIVAADSRLGEACIVNHNASVDHECNLGNGVHVAPGATICGCVTIGENVMVGAGAVILPRLTIGPNSVIGAGAVVTRDVAAGSVVFGNPGMNRS